MEKRAPWLRHVDEIDEEEEERRAWVLQWKEPQSNIRTIMSDELLMLGKNLCPLKGGDRFPNSTRFPLLLTFFSFDFHLPATGCPDL